MLCSVVVWAVLLNAARGEIFPNPLKQACGPREEFRECGPGPCAIKCDSIGENECCDVKCVPGCYCADPHILDHLGQCVHYQKCPGPGILTFKKSELTVLEGDKKAILLVTRLNGSHGQITVRWRVVNGLEPYSDLSGSLQFGEDIKEARVEILLHDNDVRNLDLVLTVELFDPSGKASVVGGRMRVVIKDDDMRPGYPEVASEDMTVMESGGVAIIRVLRVGGTDGLLRVQWRAVSLTAKVGTDFFLPAQGEVVFQEGETEQKIQVKIVDDDERESREEFQVELFDPEVGPGVLNFRRKTDSKMSTIVRIVDDDMTPGYPEMASTLLRVMEAPGKIKIRVVRRAGVDGEISVRWRIIPDTALPVIDYILPEPENALLVFPENSTQELISIQLVDDTVKEKEKKFFVELFEPKPGPGVIKFRQGENSLMRTEVILIDDDMTPGLLQLELARHVVLERVDSVRVFVVRVGGTDGVVRVRWRTVSLKEGPGTNRAEPGRDYKQGAGELTFREGETRKSFVVKILDDTEREQEESFEVELYDAQPGSGVKGFKGLGELRKATIFISDDDMRPGILQLESSSYEVREDGDTVSLTVVRTGGSDGEVRVRWRTEGRGAHYVRGTGILVFGEGETSKTIDVKIVDDHVRNDKSFTRTFSVRLFEATAETGVLNFKGLGERVRAVVIVQDDDIQPGRLFMDEPAYHILEGGFRMVRVTVRRVDGTDGRIFVRWKTTFVQGELVFEDGEFTKSVDIRLPADAPLQDFEVELFDFRTEPGNLNFRGLERSKALVSVNIMPGVLQLESTQQRVSEGAGFVRIGVVRDRGQAGRLVVRWRAVSGTAEAGSDFDAASGELVFEENIQLLFITVTILDDNVREANEHFIVELIDATTEGPGVFNFQGLGVQRQTIITIEDNDKKVGTFGFHETHVTVSERDRSVTLHVLRRGGFDGPVVLTWRAISGGAKDGVDFRSGGGGELIFVDGQEDLRFTIEILDNERRNGERSFTVGLFIPNDAADLGPDSIVTIFIKDNLELAPEPTQIFFLNDTVHVQRGAGVARFAIARVGDLSRPISVFFSTVEVGGTARAGVDFRKTMGRIPFKSGESQLAVSVSLVNRPTPPEAAPIAVFFFARISEPSEGQVVIGRDTATVVITNFRRLTQLPKDFSINEGVDRRVEFRGSNEKEIDSCPDGLILKECSPKCQTTCSGQVQMCKQLAPGCVRGCFCPPGMLLDQSLCVTPAQCSAGGSAGGFSGGFQTSFQVEHKQTMTIEQGTAEVEVRGGQQPPAPPPQPPPLPQKKEEGCPLGTTFQECASKCQDTCPGVNLLDNQCHHNGRCVRGCYCPKGMVLDNSLIRCIRPEQCSSTGGISSGSMGGLPAGGGLVGGLLGG